MFIFKSKFVEVSVLFYFILPLYKIYSLQIRNRVSAVGIETGYGLENRGVGVRVPVGSRIFSTSSRLALRPTQPPIQWVTGALSQGVKRLAREADHSPPASARSRKLGSIPSYVFMT
jgi:hypothetical protein